MADVSHTSCLMIEVVAANRFPHCIRVRFVSFCDVWDTGLRFAYVVNDLHTSACCKEHDTVQQHKPATDRRRSGGRIRGCSLLVCDAFSGSETRETDTGLCVLHMSAWITVTVVEKASQNFVVCVWGMDCRIRRNSTSCTDVWSNTYEAVSKQWLEQKPLKQQLLLASRDSSLTQR